MFLLILMAYLLGSIPTAVWVGQIFYGIDIRQHGSGNAGATNTFRILGKKAGIPVLLIDILKGFVAIRLSYLNSVLLLDHEQLVNVQLILGATALLGHIFPVYVGFRGGKGIATLLGVIIAVHPYAALICTSIFLISLIVTDYVSLSSIITSFVFPFIIILFYQSTIISLNIFALAIPVVVLITHQKNIERLLRGEESRVNLFGRAHKQDNSR